jgi:hypothetical protein
MEMKWKDRSDTAKMATKRLMPKHWQANSLIKPVENSRFEKWVLNGLYP